MTTHPGTLLIAVSALLLAGQFACAVLSYLVFQKLGRRPVWVLFTVGFFAMAVRRLMGLAEALIGNLHGSLWEMSLLVPVTVMTAAFLAALIGMALNLRDASLPTLHRADEMRLHRLSLDKLIRELEKYTASHRKTEVRDCERERDGQCDDAE